MSTPPDRPGGNAAWEPAPGPSNGVGAGYPSAPPLGPGQMLNDPVVPLDFAGWFSRVLGVYRRSFVKLAVLAVPLAVLIALWMIVQQALQPTPQEIQRQVAESGMTQPDMTTILGIVYGPVLPYLVVFFALSLVLSGLYQGAATYTALREANGQPVDVGSALRFAMPRVPAYIGWTLLTTVLIYAVFLLLLVPGYLAGSPAVLFVGFLVGMVASVWIGVTVYASLFGVLFVERAGPRRCLALIKGRFWASLGRLVVASLLYLVPAIVIGVLAIVLTFTVGLHSGVGLVLFGVLMGLLMVAVLPYMVAVTLVLYAELRHDKDASVTTRTLAAQISR
jgi:hypothetical protein